MMIAKRINFIDSLKGLAILFVVWGHSIQYLRDGSDFFHNPIIEFLYSFHLPLFFMISGFFFNSSIKLNFKEFLYKKSIQLLLPCLIWAILFESIHLIQSDRIDWIQSIKTIVFPTMWPIWFLKELFLSYILVYLSYKISSKKLIAFTMCLVFVLIAPKCNYQRFLLPMFLAGILLNDFYQYFVNHLKFTLFLSGFVFLVCLLFWDGNFTIYETEFPEIINIRTFSFDFANIDISLFRLITGLYGSIFWFLLFMKTYNNNTIYSLLSKIGIQTLSIYILQVIILENIVNRILNFPAVNLWIYNLIITPFITLLIIILCIGISRIISKNKYLSIFLLGSSAKK